LQLTPAPKWKLVVDIGDDEDVTAVSCSAGATASVATAATEQSREVHDMPIASAATSALAAGGTDARIDEVVSLLGDFIAVVEEPPQVVDESAPLTLDEQELLTETTNELPPENLGGVIQIIREAAPVGADEDEIDLEIDQLSGPRILSWS
jgi:hypothetical protein